MAIIFFDGTARPSALMKRMLRHSGDVSEGTNHKVLATRTILNRKVTFYSDGTHFIHRTGLNEEESFNSGILRFAHASLLINMPVGDKAYCYVDATKEPMEVYVYGMKLEDFIRKAKYLIKMGKVPKDYILDQEFPNVRDVRLPGKCVN